MRTCYGEWEYLFSNSAKYGPATVAGRVGIVLLPDSFSDPNKNGGSGAFVSVSQKTGATYNDNVYSAEIWKAMEYAGAVFLPAGGIFYEGTFGYSSSDMEAEILIQETLAFIAQATFPSAS